MHFKAGVSKSEISLIISWIKSALSSMYYVLLCVLGGPIIELMFYFCKS